MFGSTYQVVIRTKRNFIICREYVGREDAVCAAERLGDTLGTSKEQMLRGILVTVEHDGFAVWTYH